MQAARSGEREAIKALLADDVQVISDGGKVPLFAEGVRGVDRGASAF